MVSSTIFQKFSGEGLPHFFLGFDLGSGFALNSRALCAFDSGFTLNSRVLRALDSGFTLNFRLQNLVWPPKINSWICPWACLNLPWHSSQCVPVLKTKGSHFVILDIFAYKLNFLSGKKLQKSLLRKCHLRQLPWLLHLTKFKFC